jgi:hypothetical protein
VQRTVPFGLLCHSTLIAWYALHGHDHDDTAQRRDREPWYKTKTETSTLDMLVKPDARSSPPALCPHHPDQQQPRKSWKSTKPGHKPPHNRESRDAELPSESANTNVGIARQADSERTSGRRLADDPQQTGRGDVRGQ